MLEKITYVNALLEEKKNYLQLITTHNRMALKLKKFILIFCSTWQYTRAVMRTNIKSVLFKLCKINKEKKFSFIVNRCWFEVESNHLS